MKKRINSIDLLRMLAAFMVVTGHSKFFALPYYQSFARAAVPLFFMISGYFFGNITKEKKKDRIKRMLTLTLLANGAYLLFDIIIAATENNLIGYLTQTFTFSNAVNFLIFNESPFGVHLWFLGALLYSMIADYFLSDFADKHKKLCISGAVMLILVDVIFGKYSLLFFGRQWNLIYLRNFIFDGVSYFYFGRLFRGYDIDRLKVKTWILTALTVFFCLTSCAEEVILRYFNLSASRASYLSIFPIAVLAFVLALKKPCLNPNRLVAYTAYSGAKYSLVIYIIHPMIIDILSKLTSMSFSKTYALPFIVFAVSWLAAVAYYKVKETAVSKLSAKKA